MRSQRALASILSLEAHLGATTVRRVSIGGLLQFDAQASGSPLMSCSGTRLHPSGELRYGVKIDVFGLDEGKLAFHTARGLQPCWL